MIALQVKRNKDRFEFDVDANATVDDVFSSIEEKTNALKRDDEIDRQWEDAHRF